MAMATGQTLVARRRVTPGSPLGHRWGCDIADGHVSAYDAVSPIVVAASTACVHAAAKVVAAARKIRLIAP